MSLTVMRLLALAFFASCLSTMASAGNATAQAISMVFSLSLAAPLAYGLFGSRVADGFSKLLGIALIGTIGFAAWNLLGHPNARWAHRAFIYTGYAAAVALIVLATVLDTKVRTGKQIVFIAGGIHVATTASIALIKMCFVDRMMAAELP